MPDNATPHRLVLLYSDCKQAVLLSLNSNFQAVRGNGDIFTFVKRQSIRTKQRNCENNLRLVSFNDAMLFAALEKRQPSPSWQQEKNQQGLPSFTFMPNHFINLAKKSARVRRLPRLRYTFRSPKSSGTAPF